MKTLHLIIISVILIVIFASFNTVLAMQGVFPVLNAPYKELVTEEKVQDWSPVSNTLLASGISSNDEGGWLIEYNAHGTVQHVYHTDPSFSIMYARYNHDGTKIAFVSNYIDESPELYLFDLKNNQLTRLTNDTTVSGVTWTPDDNIVYSVDDKKDPFHYNILKLDLKNNSTSIIYNDVYYLGGFDISPDGKRIVMSQNYSACQMSEYGCSSRIFVYDVGSNTNNGLEITKTNRDTGPRWSLNGTFITFYTDRGEYHCSQTNAVTPNGRNFTNFLDLDLASSASSNCHGDIVFNKDLSLVAYDQSWGTPSGAIFFATTDRCIDNSCLPYQIFQFPFTIPVSLIGIISLIGITALIVIYRMKFRK